MNKKKFKNGQKVRWISKSPHGEKEREGIVRGYLKPGDELKLPKSADVNKLKASPLNTVHTRYLIEVKRVHARTGVKLASHWLTPKAVTFESTAKAI